MYQSCADPFPPRYKAKNKRSQKWSGFARLPCSLSYCEKLLLDDSQIHFFTGLPNMHILKSVFDHIIRQCQWNRLTVISIPPFQQFTGCMCVMLKLQLNRSLQDLAYRFQVSHTTVSRMDIRLRKLIVWLDRDDLHKTMPNCFQESFGKM